MWEGNLDRRPGQPPRGCDQDGAQHGLRVEPIRFWRLGEVVGRRASTVCVRMVAEGGEVKDLLSPSNDDDKVCFWKRSRNERTFREACWVRRERSRRGQSVFYMP